MPWSVDFGEDVDATLDLMDYNLNHICGVCAGRETHRCGISDNVFDVFRGVNMGRGVCAFGSDFGETRYDNREGLGVDNVPMEGAHLGGLRLDPLTKRCYITLTQLMASRVRFMSETGKLKHMNDDMAINQLNAHTSSWLYQA